MEDREVPKTLVTMGSLVHFRDEETKREMALRLVYPREATGDPSRISVFTPVGVALLGLSKGQSIAYETRDGRRKTLRVLDVR